jgi:DNA-binding response OmpR family regulator
VSQGRILLVDDNVDLVDNLGEILEDEGYKVLRAISCATARARAAEGFDVALVDLRLPDGDGTALAAELHQTVPGAEVVLLTGFASVESAAAAIRAGACAYLVKPCAVPELLLTVGQALRQVRLQAEREELTQRAQLAEKLAAVGRLTAGLSHEIRNPLNAAALQLSVLERRIRRLSEDGQAPLLEPLVLVRDGSAASTRPSRTSSSSPVAELVRRPVRSMACSGRWRISCPATPRPGWCSWWWTSRPAPRQQPRTRARSARCC